MKGTLLLFLFTSLLIFNSCNKNDDNPITPPYQTVPTLSSPSDGATNVTFPVTLIWNAFSGAISYALQVSIDSAFTSFVFNQSGLTSTTKQISGLSDSTKYYWRVSADNSSETSIAWSFSTASAGGSVPAIPTLLSPANLSTNQQTSPTLSWNISSGATGYNLQVSKTSSFSIVIYNQNGITTPNYQLTGLDDSTVYYWRVSASNKNGTSGNSSSWLFATAGIGTPGNPSLLTPIDGAIDVTSTVTLTWNASFGATSYTLQVSESSAFATILLNQTVSTTSRQVTNLNFSTTYYWRVSATNAFGTSNPSNSWAFTTNDGRPGVPTLLSPSDGVANQSISPTLRWNPTFGATSYTLQVSESNLFTSYVYHQSGLTSTFHQVTNLNFSTTYYWRVSATNAFGTSNPSNSKNFTTVIMNIVCPGIPSITYSGKTYNTVQMSNQCWLKENLDVGVYVASTSTDSIHSDMSNDGTIEKYCYENIESNCATFGGLYDWNEAMQYVTTSGAQGICPTGWHIPTLAEFEALRAAVNNDGNALKSIGQGTGSGAGTNTSGFSALLGGRRYDNGAFLGHRAVFWSSTEFESSYAKHLYLRGDDGFINLEGYRKEYGFSVRCLKD